MNAREILATLKKLGKPQTAAIYKRQGAGDNVFGTLTSEIAKIAKKIRVDHELAQELWATGNAEARILAILVSDPERVTRADADRLLDDGPAHCLCCYLSDFVARTPEAAATMRSWMASREEDRLEAGYGVFASRLKDDAGLISDAEAERVLGTIEKKIARAPNWGRYAMNSAVIAIGTYKPSLYEKAVATAKRIGKVEVDHGETYCKTPDAVAILAKRSKRKYCP